MQHGENSYVLKEGDKSGKKDNPWQGLFTENERGRAIHTGWATFLNFYIFSSICFLNNMFLRSIRFICLSQGLTVEAKVLIIRVY